MGDLDGVTIDFALTRSEYVRALRWGLLRDNALRLLAGVGLVATAWGLLTGASGWWSVGITWIVMSGLIWLLVPYVRWQRNPAAHAQQHHVFSERGFVVRSASAETHGDWSFYSGIKELGGLYLLLRRGRVCNIIPGRAFLSDADHRRFRDIVSPRLVGRTASPS